MALKFSTRVWVLVFLALAIVFYVAGFGLSATVFLVLGMLAELGFWIGLWRSTKDTSTKR